MWYYGAGLGICLVILVVCVAILIYIPLSLIAKGHVNETASKWRIKSYEMMVEMKKAQDDHEEYLRGGGRLPKKKAANLYNDDEKPGRSGATKNKVGVAGGARAAAQQANAQQQQMNQLNQLMM